MNNVIVTLENYIRDTNVKILDLILEEESLRGNAKAALRVGDNCMARVYTHRMLLRRKRRGLLEYYVDQQTNRLSEVLNLA